MERHAWLCLPLALFLAGALTGLESHGLYMDGVNPDYLVARWLGEARTEIRPWVLPGNLLLGRFPLLIQLYHGALPFWLGLPGYLLLGTDVAAVRMVHAGFGVLVMGGLYAFLMAFGVGRLAAIAALCVLALDPAFLLSWRTQFYITLLPLAFVLTSAALTEAGGGRWSRLAAGFCAGLAVYGYFIHAIFLPVLLIHAALRLWPARDGRGLALWLLGAALGGSAYPLGYAANAASYGFIPAAIGFACAWLGVLGFLAWSTTRARPLRWLVLAGALGGVTLAGMVLAVPADMRAHLLSPFTQHLATLEPGRSMLTLAERLGNFIHLLRLAVDGGGGASVLLPAALPETHGMPRLALLLAVLAAGAASLLWRRETSRAGVLVLALLAAHVPLALAFGDRLWVQHMVAGPVLLSALLAIALDALRPSARLVALLVLVAPLGALNALDRSATLAALERTGGAGLSSDALTRFARDVLRDWPRAVVRAPDWGVTMPFVMITGGDVAIQPDAPLDAMRQDLCAGRPVVLVLLAERTDARLAGYTEALGPARITFYAQRDGTPVLLSAAWAPGACVSPSGGATHSAPAPAPEAAR